MWVITADQIGSRRGSDLVPAALDLLDAVPTTLPFTRTVGDELQGVVPTAADALRATLVLVRDGRWSVGIGGGEVRLAGESRASDGPAFVRARAAVERAKGRRPPVPVALEDPRSGRLEPLLHLLAAVVGERSEASWRVVDLLETGATGVDVAKALDITPQAVSWHRRASLWDTEVRARHALAELMDAA
ncbi:hypothetical protein [Serinibacter salmoneus]|nr:hypothetical protein [Serinibacter salmoneus]